MWKKVLFKILKYLTQAVLLLVLASFLAKTGNMPTVVPKEYVEKIIEYTDKTLFLLKIVKDEKVIKKYSEVKQDEQPKKAVEVHAYKESKESKEVYEIDILTRIYNFFLLNNYELNIIRELNKISSTLNLYINNQLHKLNNIIDSSYVKNIIKEKELGIRSDESYLLLNNIITGFKYIQGFYIVRKDNKLITSINKERNLKINIKPLIKSLKEGKTSIDTYEINNKSYFLYLIKDYQNSMDVLFLIEPGYFNIGINNINVLYKFIVFNKNYQILNSNIIDEGFSSKMSAAIRSGSITHNQKNFKIKILKLKNINLYTGILFEKYPLIYMGLNILKILVFIVILYFILLGSGALYKKLKDIKIKQKPDMIETLTGTMMEVARSMKSTADLPSVSKASIDKSDMEEVINSVLSKYAQQWGQESHTRKETDFSPLFKGKKRNISIKEVDGWKIIES